MTRLTGLARAAACAIALLAGGLTAAPAFAAPADVEFLQGFLGDWKGRGTLTGANSETVVCKLTLVDANENKVNYTGRCSLAGTTLTMSGTIAYIEASRRFEAAMTSNVSFSSKAIGRKQGNAIVFTLNDTQKDDAGNDMQVSAAMTLANEKINVEFNVLFPETGDSIRAKVPFSQ